MKSIRLEPFGHSVPRFTGWSGSPSMWMMLDFAFLALSPSPYIRIPQPTEQYGQVLRVSVVRDSLYWRTSASAGAGEKPMRAKLDPASVVAEIFRNCRRDMWVM